MSEVMIPMDPMNPGHVYACCGLLELLGRKVANVEARFVVDVRKPRRAEFQLRGKDKWKAESAVEDLLQAEYAALEGVAGEEREAIRPIVMRLPEGQEIELDWWLRPFRDGGNSLKAWGGQMTSLGLFSEVQRQCRELGVVELALLFYSGAASSTRFGLDPRSSWNALDVGYSLNEQGQDAASYPFVELLGAVGLWRFRPNTQSRDSVKYALWGEWLGVEGAAMALNLPWPGLKHWAYEYSIAARGQSYKYLTYGKPAGQMEEESED